MLPVSRGHPLRGRAGTTGTNSFAPGVFAVNAARIARYLLQSLFFLGLPIGFLAYGAFLGGRAVRFFRERDGAGGCPPRSGLEGLAAMREES
jgi:hypothetical protein